MGSRAWTLRIPRFSEDPILIPEAQKSLSDSKRISRMQAMTESRSNRYSTEGPTAGFTLVEITYVAIIIGILAMFAAPLLDVSKYRMNSAVVEVATELMAAQRNAVLRGHDVVVAIDENEKWLRIHLDANNDGYIQATEDTKVAQLGDGVTFGRAGSETLSPSSQTITFTQKQGSLKALTFHRNGSASEAGLIYLTHEQVKDPLDDRAIEIIRSTAKVKCWNNYAGSWKETC